MPILGQVSGKRTHAPYENYCIFIFQLLIPVMVTSTALLLLLAPSLTLLRVMLLICTKMQVALHVKSPLLLSDFLQNCKMSTHLSCSPQYKMSQNPFWVSLFTHGQLTTTKLTGGFTTSRCKSAETDLLVRSTLVSNHILHIHVHQYKILGGGGACDKYVESN